MTKHELLDFIFIYSPITRKDIEDFFDISESRISKVIKQLRTQGLITKLNDKRPEKFGLTRTGLRQLTYYNENGCTNKLCSCNENDDEVYENG